MKIWNRIRENLFVKNILLAAIIVATLSAGVLWWLNIYTRHGKAVIVPDVKGLQEQEAVSFLKKKALLYEVVDSAYVKNARPGSVAEMTPQAGTKVKENRIIYLTINAFTPQTFAAPEVRNLSQRQARAMLNAIGFESVNVELVPGEYQELVVGLQCQGRNISVGDRLPTNSVLTLIVSSGVSEIFEDTIPIQENQDEF